MLEILEFSAWYQQHLVPTPLKACSLTYDEKWSCFSGKGVPYLRPLQKCATWCSTTKTNWKHMFENITFNKYPKNCHKANDVNVSPWPGPCVSLLNHSTPPAVAPQWSSRHPKHRSNVPATLPATLAPSPGGKVNVRNVWEKPILCMEIFLFFV